MAILEQGFETLSSSGYFNGNDINRTVSSGGEKTLVTLDKLINQAKLVHENWETEIVDNSNGIQFGLTDDLSFTYKGRGGINRTENITQFGFQQLCGRMGIPAQYIEKCVKNGKEDLAIKNFKTWANEYNGNLKIMRNNNVVRAVVSEKYAPYESYHVLTDLKKVVDTSRWVLIQSFLSEDKLVARFVDTKSPIYEDENSKMYVLFTVRSSDVGKGSLSVTMGVWRQVCSNGLIVAKGDSVLYKGIHSGSFSETTKLEVLSRAMYKANKFGTIYANAIDGAINTHLNQAEFKLWTEKVTRDLKLSKKNQEHFKDLIENKYDRSMWGIINGVTELAQKVTVDSRLDFEIWSGDVFSRFIA